MGLGKIDPCALIALAALCAGAGTLRADDWSTWQHAADFRLDTRPGGADVAGDVADFPLLVRLDSGSLPFAEAKPDGSDLRVSAPGGSALAFQVERWDAIAKRAEVWIRVPLIKGNSDTGFVRLHWGNAKATGASEAKAVFDGTLGWSGAWHLTGATLSDATGASAAADASNSQSAEGVIAGGRMIAGNAGGLTIADNPALDPADAVAVGIWIKADNWAGAAKTILQKGGDAAQYALIQSGADSLAWILGGPGHEIPLKAVLPSAGAWHHVAATYDGAESRLYLDGRLAAAKPVTGPLPAPSGDLCLGCRSAGQGKPRNSFKGFLDEATVSRRVRSEDFIKLSFANQRSQQVLVRVPRLASCRAALEVPADTAMAEGSLLMLRGKANCATSWDWSPLSGPAPRILDPEAAEQAITLPRITHDTVIAYRFTARFGDSVAARDVAVKVRETIPDPVFTLGAIPSWNGRDSVALRPAISNLAAIKASRDSVLHYAWTVSGPPTDTLQKDGSLILASAREAGSLTIGLCLDNGGPAACRSIEITVDPAVIVGLGKAREPVPGADRLAGWHDVLGRRYGPEKTGGRAPFPVIHGFRIGAK